VIPEFDPAGNLPAGIHEATWDELATRYGTTANRRRLLDELKLALESLRNAGCRRAYLNGSFVTAKDEPGDFDACWEAALVDSRLWIPFCSTSPSGGERRRRSSAASCSRQRCPLTRPETLPGLLPAGQGHRRTQGHRRNRSKGSLVITNERQYRITRAQLKRFEEATEAQGARDPSPDVDPRIHAAMGDALCSEAEELRRQLHEYEQLRSGEVKARNLSSLTDLPRALIEARIAGHITQKELADRLGLAEQQIQRWEATNYAGVAVERMQNVADALGARITEKVSFGPPPSPTRRGRDTAEAGRHTTPSLATVSAPSTDAPSCPRVGGLGPDLAASRARRAREVSRP
jgi:transcriptional regulator with XRE-family HTH domain